MAGVPMSCGSSFCSLILPLAASLPLMPMGWSARIMYNYEICKTFFNASSGQEGLYFMQMLFPSVFVSLSSTQYNSKKSGSTAEVCFCRG